MRSSKAFRVFLTCSPLTFCAFSTAAAHASLTMESNAGNHHSPTVGAIIHHMLIGTYTMARLGCDEAIRLTLRIREGARMHRHMQTDFESEPEQGSKIDDVIHRRSA